MRYSKFNISFMGPWIIPVFLLVPLSVSCFQYFLLMSILDFFIPLFSLCVSLWHNLQPSHSWKGQKKQTVFVQGWVFVQKLPAASPSVLGIQDGIKAGTFFYVSHDWTSDLLWEWKPSGVFLTTGIFHFLWKQKYQMCHCNQIPLWVVTWLPKCLIFYGLLVNFCGERFHSIMQASVLLSNTTASDWTGLSWKGLWVWSAMIQIKTEHFWVNRGHYVKATVSRVRPWGWWAGSKAHGHSQTLPSERWDSVEHRGAVCRQSCLAALAAVRFLSAFREMVTSKSEAATQGSPILALFGVFFPSGVVYSHHVALMNTSKFCWGLLS